MAKFKDFEIRIISDYQRKFEIVKWKESNSFNHTCFTIGYLEWDEKEGAFNFKSCGTRYLKYREDGLEKWILAWCEMKKIEFKYEEEEKS